MPINGLMLRIAMSADRHAIKDLEVQARALLEAQGMHLRNLQVPDDFEQDPHWDLALVAELGGRVLGVARLTELDATTVALDQLSVHPEAAHQGVGRALLVEIISICRGRGYSTITGTTFRDVLFNAPFYSSLGAKEDVHPHAAMQERRQVEVALGLDAIGRRVVMRLPLQPEGAEA